MKQTHLFLFLILLIGSFTEFSYAASISWFDTNSAESRGPHRFSRIGGEGSTFCHWPDSLGKIPLYADAEDFPLIVEQGAKKWSLLSMADTSPSQPKDAHLGPFFNAAHLKTNPQASDLPRLTRFILLSLASLFVFTVIKIKDKRKSLGLLILASLGLLLAPPPSSSLVLIGPTSNSLLQFEGDPQKDAWVQTPYGKLYQKKWRGGTPHEKGSEGTPWISEILKNSAFEKGEVQMSQTFWRTYYFVEYKALPNMAPQVNP